MEQNSLDRFITDVRKIWGPLSTEVVENTQKLIDELVKAPESEPWLKDLLENKPDSKELYRDPDHGFILLAHTETENLFRRPHDHGDGWVIYAVQNGEMEMRAYARTSTPPGGVELVRRETYRVTPGISKIYLPRDIHDTKCISKSVLMFRFTSTDLKNELKEGRMLRY